jgi:hypothetical protein
MFDSEKVKREKEVGVRQLFPHPCRLLLGRLLLVAELVILGYR